MRNIFMAIICLISTNPIFAQIKMGIKVSPQYTWTTTDSKSLTTGDPHVNISYGLVLDYHINENYSFGTEFSIGTFGGTIKPDSVYITNKSAAAKDLEYTYKLQYINVPFIIKMRTKEIGYLRYYAEFGLGMSYNFKAKADISSTSASVDLENVDVNSPDPKDKLTIENDGVLSQEVNFFRSSIIIGAGIQYNAFGNTLLVAGLRYDSALNDFTDEERWKASMNFLALHIGVMF
jgi:hypothetical protein